MATPEQHDNYLLGLLRLRGGLPYELVAGPSFERLLAKGLVLSDGVQVRAVDPAPVPPAVDAPA